MAAQHEAAANMLACKYGMQATESFCCPKSLLNKSTPFATDNNIVHLASAFKSDKVDRVQQPYRENFALSVTA
jgi:hypothetical protein